MLKESDFVALEDCKICGSLGGLSLIGLHFLARNRRAAFQSDAFINNGA